MANFTPAARASSVASNLLFYLVLCFVIFKSTDGSSSRRRHQPYIITRYEEPVGSPFNPCDMNEGSVSSVQVSDCSDQESRCTLHGGTNATIGLDFASKVDSNTLKTIVHGIVGGIPVPFHVPNSDACKGSGVQCPLKAGNSYQYSTTLPVLKSYPKLNVEVKWELQSATGTVACVIIPAAIR